MSNAIIRGIWGNPLAAKRAIRPPDLYASMLRSVLHLKERGDVVDRFYCFGQDNADFLKYYGFDPICIDQRPWANPKIRPEFHHRWDGAWVHGMSHWWHKLKIVEFALREHDSVLWVDSDVTQLRKLPPDFWEELNQGPDFRASLYLQRNWTWGAGWRHVSKWDPSEQFLIKGPGSRRAAQTVPGCGYFRINSKELIKEALEIQHEHHFWLDHQIFAWLLDRRHGGWVGDDKYIELGYHTNRYYYGRQLYPPSEMDTVWQAGDRGTVPL